MSVDLHPLLQASQDPVRDPHRLVLVFQVLEQHRELVAAETGHRVVGAQARFQPPRHFHEEVVAGREAQGLVDRLEPVDVEEEHRERPSRALSTLEQRALQAVEEQAPVGEAGEAVVQRRVQQLVLQSLQVGVRLGRRSG